MKRFIGTDRASVELFFNIYTSRIVTFCHTVGLTFVSCVVEVCRLGLEPPWHSSFPLSFENADADRTRISSGVTKYENHWKRGPNYRVDDDWMPPSWTTAGDVLTVESCVARDLTQPTMNFYRRYALYIQNLYHRPHFTVGGSWNKSPNFNRRNDATVRTREVSLVDASCDVTILSRKRSHFPQ